MVALIVLRLEFSRAPYISCRYLGVPTCPWQFRYPGIADNPPTLVLLVFLRTLSQVPLHPPANRRLEISRGGTPLGSQCTSVPSWLCVKSGFLALFHLQRDYFATLREQYWPSPTPITF